jgi:hypothetical protein
MATNLNLTGLVAASVSFSAVKAPTAPMTTRRLCRRARGCADWKAV